jgi:sulfur carrier protein ThiS
MIKSKRITITVGRFGSTPHKVEVNEKSTVKEALQQAGITLAPAEKVWVGGEPTVDSDILENKDVLNIVGSKEGGR